ncbi:MAG: hypothetical protein SGCHY_004892, partial [Lobulomycetales sp.]
ASSIHESKASHSFSELKDYGDLKIFHVNKKLVELNAMGFFDQDLNKRLLLENRFDIRRVVDILVRS